MRACWLPSRRRPSTRADRKPHGAEPALLPDSPPSCTPPIAHGSHWFGRYLRPGLLSRRCDRWVGAGVRTISASEAIWAAWSEGRDTRPRWPADPSLRPTASPAPRPAAFPVGASPTSTRARRLRRTPRRRARGRVRGSGSQSRRRRTTGTGLRISVGPDSPTDSAASDR